MPICSSAIHRFPPPCRGSQRLATSPILATPVCQTPCRGSQSIWPTQPERLARPSGIFRQKGDASTKRWVNSSRRKTLRSLARPPADRYADNDDDYDDDED